MATALGLCCGAELPCAVPGCVGRGSQPSSAADGEGAVLGVGARWGPTEMNSIRFLFTLD